ncbi:MAG: hypothetical protein MJ200_00440 [Mycoplasmoidaceae bacterium]|nr:hypothetical protein [Mycoplasmoidaceae bacterium]
MTGSCHIKVRNVEYFIKYNSPVPPYGISDWSVIPVAGYYASTGDPETADTWLSSHDDWSIEVHIKSSLMQPINAKANHSNYSILVDDEQTRETI